jgi:lipid-A-disaccharide synthase-like uncharacterized protein
MSFPQILWKTGAFRCDLGLIFFLRSMDMVGLAKN